MKGFDFQNVIAFIYTYTGYIILIYIQLQLIDVSQSDEWLLH